jgi:hypothetical protein
MSKERTKDGKESTGLDPLDNRNKNHAGVGRRSSVFISEWHWAGIRGKTRLNERR